MPVFKPNELVDAKAITFSAKDLADATPTNSLEDIQRTSTPSPAQAARQRLASRGITPEQIKAHPLMPTEYGGPMADYGFKDKVDPDPSHKFWSWEAAKKNLNPLNMLDAGLQAASNFVPEGAAPGMQRPPQDLTAGNFSRDMSAVTTLPTPTTFSDTANEAYRRGESGQSTGDMFQGPAAMAAMLGVAKGVPAAKEGFSNKFGDIANDMSLKAQRSALGSKPSSFEHGAEPDVYTRELGPQLSEGRLARSIQKAKGEHFDAISKDLDSPRYNSTRINPKEAINPVLEDARSRAIGDEGTKIQQFDQKVANKINELGRDGFVNPKGLNQLRKWVDGFISSYKEEPIGTVRDMAQNIRAALRKQLETVAPEVTDGNHVIQSLIQAEEDVFNKSHSLQPPPTTFASIVRNTLKPMIPDTWIKTKAASTLQSMAGEHGQLSPILVGSGTPPSSSTQPGSPPPFNQAGGPPQIPSPNGPPQMSPPAGLLPPAPEGVTGGVPPTPPPTTPTSGPPTDLETQFQQGAADQAARMEASGRGSEKPMEALNTPVPARSEVTAVPSAKPTHIQEGTQVAGIDEQGNFVGGTLKYLYPEVENGAPVWKGLIEDLPNNRTIRVPAENLKSMTKASGPIQDVNSTVPKPVPARVTTEQTALDKMDSTPKFKEGPTKAPTKRITKTKPNLYEAATETVKAPSDFVNRLKEALKTADVEKKTAKTPTKSNADIDAAKAELERLIQEQQDELAKENAPRPKKRKKADE